MKKHQRNCNNGPVRSTVQYCTVLRKFTGQRRVLRTCNDKAEHVHERVISVEFLVASRLLRTPEVFRSRPQKAGILHYGFIHATNAGWRMTNDEWRQTAMTRRTRTLQGDSHATSSPIDSNRINPRLNSPSAEELFRELVVGPNSEHPPTASRFLTPNSSPVSTPIPDMADRFPSLEDFSPSEFLLLLSSVVLQSAPVLEPCAIILNSFTHIVSMVIRSEWHSGKWRHQYSKPQCRWRLPCPRTGTPRWRCRSVCIFRRSISFRDSCAASRGGRFTGWGRLWKRSEWRGWCDSIWKLIPRG
jgi:hypothetical protein